MRQNFLSSIILELTVFVSGAVVMAYEIIGSRILAPHIGTSTYTWTSLIGIILAALSFGYWFGGKLADKKPDIKILGSVLFLAGGCVSATILFHDAVLILIARSALPIELKAVVSALFLFAPASVFLGFVLPYAVKIKTKTLDKTGETVGGLYALSTIGSIVGTFAAGFFLIPFVGSTRTLYLIAASLFLLSILLVSFSITRLNIGILTVFFIGILVNEGLSAFLRQTQNYFDFDTQYNRIQIFETTHGSNGKPIRAIKIDPLFFQSSMYLGSDELTSEYAKFYHLIRHFKPDFRNTLMIGGAGFSFPKEYLKKYPQADLDVVEIDPGMTDLAKRFFRLPDNPHLKIYHEDGRVFLNKTLDGRYDAVLMDAFTSLFSVPFQLTTVEAVRQIHRVLAADGIVISNIGGKLEGSGNQFVLAEVKTYKAVFPQVFLFKVNPKKADSEVQNLIMIALKADDFAEIDPQDGEIRALLDKKYRDELPENMEILTDELAPIEYYNSFIHRTYNGDDTRR